MNIEDLAFLAEHVTTIDGQRPERLMELRDRIRAARRRRAAATVVGAVALATAVITVTALLPGSSENGGGPIDPPSTSSTSSPTTDPSQEPDDPNEFTADFGPQDMIHDNVAIGSGTNQPGSTEIHANLPYYGPYFTVVAYCRGSGNVWWVGNGNYGQCTPDAALGAAAPVEYQPVGNAEYPLPEAPSDQENSVDLFLTEPLTARAQRCVEDSPDTFTTQECLSSNDVAVLSNADATLGYTAYVHSAPLVVDDPLGQGYEALANLDGVEYEFEHGVASAPGTTKLATHLDPSEDSRLILLALKHGREGSNLRVDGRRATFPADLAPGSPWHYGRQEYVARAVLPPGEHEVTVDLPPREQAVLLVYEASSSE